MKTHPSIQTRPKGIAEAFILGEDFIGHDSVCLILGDNVFYGANFTEIIEKSISLQSGGLIFGYYVDDPSRYGVIDEIIGVLRGESKYFA